MQDESEKARELANSCAELQKSQTIQKEMSAQNDELVQRVEEGQHHITLQQQQIKQLHEDLALTQELVAQSAAHSAGLQSQLDTTKENLAKSKSEVETHKSLSTSDSATLNAAMQQISDLQQENQNLLTQVSQLRLKATTKTEIGNSHDELEVSSLREENRSLVAQVAELRDTVSKSLNLAKPESVALSEAKTRIVTQAAKIEQLKAFVKQLKLSLSQQKEAYAKLMKRESLLRSQVTSLESLADAKPSQPPLDQGPSQGFYDTRWANPRDMERQMPSSLVGSQQHASRDTNNLMSGMWAQPTTQFVQDLEQFQKSVNNWKTTSVSRSVSQC